MNSYNYILVNGYGWSGSSALVDMFREFDFCFVPQKEFRLIKDPHGIRDLDIQLNNSIDALNEDIAIKDFIKFIKIYSRKTGKLGPLGLAYNKDFGHDFDKVSYSYVKKLVDYKYSGFWWYLDIINDSYLKYIIGKILYKIHLFDYRKHTSMFLTIKNEEEFLDITRKYIDLIFRRLLKNNMVNAIVLDQAIPANRPSWGQRYFYQPKVLIVDRDPRDVYIDLIKEKSLVGYDVAVKHDVGLFIDWFRKVRKQDKDAAVYKRIQFEDLVLDYDNTVKKIYDFCDLAPKLHSRKLEIFNPEVSKKNIGMWKQYEYRDELETIKKELGEFIVQ